MKTFVTINAFPEFTLTFNDNRMNKYNVNDQSIKTHIGIIVV